MEREIREKAVEVVDEQLHKQALQVPRSSNTARAIENRTELVWLKPNALNITLATNRTRDPILQMCLERAGTGMDVLGEGERVVTRWTQQRAPRRRQRIRGAGSGVRGD